VESQCSVEADRFLERSLGADKETVFLTWHNVCFTVPTSKQDQQNAAGSTSNYIDIDDPRVQLITDHNKDININNTHSTISNVSKITNQSVTPGSNSGPALVGKNKK